MPDYSSAADSPAPAQRRFIAGVALQQGGQLPQAIAAWREALVHDPHHLDARYNLAVGLGASGDTAGAETCYAQILLQCPNHRQSLYNLANLKMRQGDAAAAEPLYRRLLTANPQFTGGWTNLALARSTLGDLAEAELCLRRALVLQPGDVGAHWNLANLLLSARRWPEAWAEYEWRLRRPECPPPPAPVRDWTAGDTQARRILLWNDQGMGDALQFARYVPHLAARGHEVWLRAGRPQGGIAVGAGGQRRRGCFRFCPDSRRTSAAAEPAASPGDARSEELMARRLCEVDAPHEFAAPAWLQSHRSGVGQ